MEHLRGPTEGAEQNSGAPQPAAASGATDDRYVVPLVHARVPARGVEIGFWAALAAGTVVGAIDPPLALLLGAGIVMARHRHR